MKKLAKYAGLLIAFLSLSYPIKEYFGRGSLLAIIFSGLIFLVLYRVINENKKHKN
ncbi:hypothetical protein [Streptococcus pacificus]|uniref:Uncharacterized protein n=1 Tax=Streptococcus pacificus TaxID=2740577 RepID=A0ABS0ZJ76_9STRE|nr:hypothetical protein [Streptococcus pacificus]MBJ8326055.1 hypothetical protein [Streptococcus pacificus]